MDSGEVFVPALPGNKRLMRVAALLLLAVLAVVAAVAVAGMTGVRLGIFSASATTLRLVASTSFLAAAVVGVAVRGSSRYRLSVLVGLIFCWLGDVLGPVNFDVGAVCFFVGHCFFIAAFAGRPARRRRMVWAAVFYAVAGGGILMWLLPHVGVRDLPLVLGYVAVISVMAVMACGLTGGWGWFVAVAAFLFYVSDVFVARGQYVAPGALNSIMCYPLYYGACMMLALSVSAGTRLGKGTKGTQGT